MSYTTSALRRFIKREVLGFVCGGLSAALVAGITPAIGAEMGASTAEAAQVDKLFSEFDKPGSPGCMVGIIRDGEFIYKRGFGLADIENNIPFSSKSRVYLASMSKQFTAAATYLAVEQGFFALDDDIRKYLPAMPDYGHKITINNLIHQTSGLRDFVTMIALLGERTEDVHDEATLMAMITRQKTLNFVPGARYEYSNSNYFLLGAIIKATTGQSLRTFAKVSIFDPLGMNDTFFADNIREVIPNRARAYAIGRDGQVRMEWSINFIGGGAGDVMSTVDDLLKWDRNFYADKLGKGGLIKSLRSKGALNDGSQANYGGGLMLVDYRGLPVDRHTGAFLGFGTMMARFPDQHFTTMTLCNPGGGLEPWKYATAMADIYLPKAFKAKAVTDTPFVEKKLEPAALAGLAGLYKSTTTHAIRTATVKDDRLYLGNTPLLVGDATHFRTETGHIIAFAKDRGAVRMVERDPFPETYELIQPVQVSEADLAPYVGDYVSDDLQATYHIGIQNGALKMSGPGELGPTSTRWPTALAPGGADEFFSSRFAVSFHRDGAKKVTSFTLNLGRVQNLAFVRSDRGL